MHILKGETRNFDAYQVSVPHFKVLPRTIWNYIMRQYPTTETEEILKGVIEADDSSGQLVSQVMDAQDRLVFTNGIDDIVMTDSAKLLLLLPNIRQAFLMSGYKPKTTSTYRERIFIRYRGPLSHVSNVTVKVEPESLETE